MLNYISLLLLLLIINSFCKENFVKEIYISQKSNFFIFFYFIISMIFTSNDIGKLCLFFRKL